MPLAGCGGAGEAFGDLYDDVGACWRVIAEADGPVVLCGRCYGGVIITEAGVDDCVFQLLCVTSGVRDAGQSQADVVVSEPGPWLSPGEDGTGGVISEMVREFFLQDWDEVTIEQALGRVTRRSLTPFTPPSRRIAWRQKPATYVVCVVDDPGRGAASTRWGWRGCCRG